MTVGTMSGNRVRTICFVGVLIILIGVVVWVATPDPEENKLMKLGTTFSWGYENKYTLNITAPTEATHYSVEMGSDYIYLGEEYYDLTEVPENRIIEVHRSGFHQVKILYWVHEENEYYSLIGMGVYEN